jgi:6-phosphogluconolactonase
MNNLTEHFYDNRDALFEALTQYCQNALQSGCTDNGSASFMVSGGSTPAPLYQRLAKLPLPWQQIKVALVDERWVGPEHKSSNQAFIQSTLMQDNASKANFTVMKTLAATAKDGLDDTSANYAKLPQPFDLTILGMGGDGHTASIFPECDGIEQALDSQSDQLLSAITAKRSEVTGDNLERITLSLAGLLKSRQLVLLITGEEKLAVYRQALNQSNPQKMPVSAVLTQQQVPVHVFWAP